MNAIHIFPEASPELLQSGDIVIFRNEFVWYQPITWLATLIRFFTKSPYNHAGIVVTSWGVPMINEALGGGIRCRPADKYLARRKSSILILRPKVPVDEREFCIQANSLIGTKYNFKGLIDQLIYRVTGRWTGHTGRFAETYNRLICTQYVAWCYGLHAWWKYSVKELLDNNDFVVVYSAKYSR
jgi:hypothetical protein